MVDLKPVIQNKQKIPTIDRRQLRSKQILALILASVFIHGVGLFILSLFQPTQSNPGQKLADKPVDFVVVPPPESAKKPPAKKATADSDNSPAYKAPKVTPANPPSKQPETPPVAAPTPSPQPTAPPKSLPNPPAKEPLPKETPVLSGSDKTQASALEPKSKPQSNREPAIAKSAPQPLKKEPVAPSPTLNKPSKSVLGSVPESTSSKSPANSSEGANTLPRDSAASLLGGDLKKTYGENGTDTFFSPEALAYEAVLDPEQLKALQGFDLEGYQKRLYGKVKSNWQPSFSQKYTTWLTFNIEKNGQISELKVVESSGSTEFDQLALEAVSNAVPLEPLPADFPLEHLEFKYQFYLY